MFVIGIAGGSGSGKTTIVERLLTSSDLDGVSHLPHDAYYRSREDMPEEHRMHPNWDHPDTLDNDLFIQHMDALKKGEAVQRPVYDFAHHRRETKTVLVKPGAVLLVEGILLYSIPKIRKRIELKVFIDTPADLRILRRMKRDVHERERSVDSVVEQYLDSVRPMHVQYVEPSKKFADVVIPWELHNEPAIALLAARVREHLPDDEIEMKAI
ncbi:uridine kinase [soil metagenome]